MENFHHVLKVLLCSLNNRSGKMKCVQSLVFGAASLAAVVVASPPLPSYNAPRAGPKFVSSKELQNDISEKA
jgi:hypothetical protein